MAEKWGDKLPTVDEVYKLYDEEKFREFMFAAAVLLEADAKLPVGHVTKPPVDHVITITILAANVEENPFIATGLLVIAQKYYYRARALDQQPAGVGALDWLGEALERLEKAIKAKFRGSSQEHDGEGEGESESEENDDEDSSLDRTADQEASEARGVEQQEEKKDQQQQDAVLPIRGRVIDKSTEAEATETDDLCQGQDKLVCDKCQASLQGEEALAAHDAQCKLPETDPEAERLEREIETLQKKLIEHKEKRRTTLQAEREVYVREIRSLQSLVDKIDHELTKL